MVVLFGKQAVALLRRSKIFLNGKALFEDDNEDEDVGVKFIYLPLKVQSYILVS